jgi:hypothetical protein
MQHEQRSSKTSARKGQMFIVSVVFLIGMIFVVQQALFNYSSIDMASPYSVRDEEIFANILGVVNRTMAETHFCNETKDGFSMRMERLKASLLEEFGREYTIEIAYQLNCSAWDNAPPQPAPLSLTLSVGGQGRDTRGNFVFYHPE